MEYKFKYLGTISAENEEKEIEVYSVHEYGFSTNPCCFEILIKQKGEIIERKYLSLKEAVKFLNNIIT